MKEPKQRTILIAGSGFLSEAVCAWFSSLGWKIRILTRNPAKVSAPSEAIAWDGQTRGTWEKALSEADVLLNLCGRSVDCRYNGKNRREILESRVQPTRLLGQAIADCPSPPRVWLNAASATVYRHAEDRSMDEETGEIGSGFSVDVCQAWEAEARCWESPKTRQIILRTSMVLGHGGNSVYPVLARLARFGLAGAMGTGSQFVSWIHVDDFCRAIDFLIGSDLRGAVNVTAPHPATNRYLMKSLRQSLGRRLGLPATKWMLEAGAFFLRTETELILKSRRVEPRRLRESGFRWNFPTLPEALADLRDRSPPSSPRVAREV